MDPIKRGNLKLRRYFFNSSLPPTTPLRSLLDNSRPNSLRQLIDGKMFAFVLPSGPIGDANVVCTHARLEVIPDNEFHASYRLYARIEAKTSAPVIVALGFNFYAGGRFMFGLPAMNYPGWDSHSTIYFLHGPSHWLANNLLPAYTQGVNFRIHSNTDLQKSMRVFVREFVSKLDGPKNRLMGFFDEDGEADYTQLELAVAGFSQSDVSAASGLPFDWTYPVGAIYDYFFS